MKLVSNLTGVLLLGAGCAMLLVTWTIAHLVLPHEPILGLSAGGLLGIVGALATVLSLLCLFNTRGVWHIYLAAWFATVLSAYQIGLYWTDGNGLSGYMTGFSQSFGISGRVANIIAILVTGCLTVMTYWALLCQRQRQRLDEHLLKIVCPACGGHLKFDQTRLGEEIPCPHCEAMVVLRKSENVKTSCYLCKGHIDFPSYALGRKIICPHCRGNITLRLEQQTSKS